MLVGHRGCTLVRHEADSTIVAFQTRAFGRQHLAKPSAVILHQRMCDSCHGPADRIDPAVQAMLAVRYPGDRATGFVEGQLRGWFWVEVPRQPE